MSTFPPPPPPLSTFSPPRARVLLLEHFFASLSTFFASQVRIFAGCPRDFYHALVTKLSPCICVAGDYVFYEGDAGTRMYFMKRGAAEVIKDEKVVHTLTEGDYFGEMALLTSQPRMADVKAKCGCMLLSLNQHFSMSTLPLFRAAILPERCPLLP